MTTLINLTRIYDIALSNNLETFQVFKELFQQGLTLYIPLADMVPLKLTEQQSNEILTNKKLYISEKDYRLFSGDILPDSFDYALEKYLKRTANDIFIHSSITPDLSALQQSKKSDKTKRGQQWSLNREAVAEAVQSVIIENLNDDSFIWKMRKNNRCLNAAAIARHIDNYRYRWEAIKDEKFGTGPDFLKRETQKLLRDKKFLSSLPKLDL